MGSAVAGSAVADSGRATTDILVADGLVTVAADGLCSLIEAIHNANDTATGQPYPDCAAGDPTGWDEIVLPSQSAFSLIEADNTTYGPSGLPVITSPLRINSEARATIARDPAAEPFRILAVGRDGRLSLGSLDITGGEATGTGRAVEFTYAAAGGGVLNLGQLILEETVISGNTAFVGGGIYNGGELDGHVHLVANQATDEGDALLNFGDAELRDSDIRENDGAQATIINEGRLSINGGYIRDNGAHYGLLNRANLTVEYVVFQDGQTAIANENVATLRDMTITGHNLAVDNRASALIERSALVNNNRGIYNQGELRLFSSTISGNHSGGVGGGILATEGRIYGSFNTISDNSAARGGGIFVSANLDSISYSCTSGSVRLYYSILSGNGGTIGPEAYVYSSTYRQCRGWLLLRQSVVGHDSDAGVVNTSLEEAIIPTGPPASILKPLVEHNHFWRNFHGLPAGSPAIDALPDATCDQEPVYGVDQLWQDRNQDGDLQPSDHECDMGAVERQPPHHIHAPFIARGE